MTDKDQEFLRKLRETFRIEANEHLETMATRLLALESEQVSAQRARIVETIFREAHSLKGAARAVNSAEVEAVCHALEDLFFALKTGRISPTANLFDLVHQALDLLARLLDSQPAAGTPRPAPALLIRQLERATRGEEAAHESEPAPPMAQDVPLALPAEIPAGLGGSSGSGTIRVDTAKLDAVMRQTEELLAPRLAAGQRATELAAVRMALATWEKERVKIQPVLRAIDRTSVTPRERKGGGSGRASRDMRKLLDYLDAEGRWLKLVCEDVAKLQTAAERDRRALGGMVDGLLHDVKAMHMLPFSTLLDAVPRLTRELARDQGKQVNLAIRGGEIEIDRRILEEMKDPLTHFVRNAIDHGIEKPDVRERKGKAPAGSLAITVGHKDSTKVAISIADDGAGIDVGKVGAAAIRLNLRSAAQMNVLDDRAALALIFESGLSTSPIVTDLSGRGLGLAIVREKIERLGGEVALETAADAGTTFRIILPLTLATFRGVLVAACERSFIIPAANVERVVRVAECDVGTVENRETIALGGQAVAVARLAEVLGLSRTKTESATDAQAVVLVLGGDRIAFRVDAVVAEHEVLVKRLGPQLACVPHISGASVLGTGEVIPVLNVPDLMKSAAKATTVRREPLAPGAPQARKRSVLVVEDSITSRALLKNILEAAGYGVTTAVDGMEAYTTLKTGAFDLVVSDVEMPRMDGFELTAKIRTDSALAGLPVVLVTALGSREHRERGIDVGANAYIVKSSFDQGNLLEAVARLI